MKYLKTYENIVNEKMGFPSSLELIENYLSNFIEKELLSCNGSDYSKRFILNMNDIPLNIDFPLQELELKLDIIEKDISSVSGRARNFTMRRGSWINHDSYVSKGKIFAGIDIEIWKSKSDKDIMKNLHQMLRHELLHLYKYYKTLIKKIKPIKSYPKVFFSNAIMEIMYKYELSITFYRLLYTYYHFFSKDEFNSFMAQLTDKSTIKKEEIQGYDSIMMILNYNYDEIYDKIIEEFKEHYPEKNLNEIPEDLIRDVERSYSYYKIKTTWLKKYDVPFSNFIKIIFDEIQQKKPKFIKKSNKIFYSR